MEKESGQRIAVFFDAENLIISSQKAGLPVNVRAVIDRIREEGKLSFARAYSDWTQHPVHGYTSQFHDNVIELTQLSSKYGKNTADMQIVVDAMEMAMTANSPEIFILIAGDRDFVPLVQKLKRFGKRVVGIGLRETTSPALNAVCDAFLFYNNLLPEAPVLETEETTKVAPSQGKEDVSPHLKEPITDELREAFSVLLRAVIAIERRGDTPMGANVRPMMEQLNPSFDLSAYSYLKFKDFVDAAVEAGFVEYGEERNGHFSLQSPPTEKMPVTSHPTSFLETSFADSREALQAYRQVLANKRVPLIPWNERQMLVRHLWKAFENNPGGLAPEEAEARAFDAAGMNFLNIPDQAIQKLMFTLSLGDCFARNGSPARYDLRDSQPIEPACDVEEALDRLNCVYIRGIRIDHPKMHLQQRALALLLFDSDNDDQLVKVDSFLKRIGYIR